jgi:hypothetical protein
MKDHLLPHLLTMAKHSTAIGHRQNIERYPGSRERAPIGDASC